MSTQFDFTIPTPCHEDWNQMTPQDQGRFCAACKKCVFDLSAKSKTEIRDLYVAQGGDLCGRIRPSQLAPTPKALKMPLRRLLAHVHQSGWGQLRRFAFALLLAFGLSATGWAQTAPADTTLPLIDEPMIAGGIGMVDYRYVEPKAKLIEVNGEVLDAEGNRLTDVEVVLETSKGKRVTHHSDKKGRFRFVARSTDDYTLYAVQGEAVAEWNAYEDGYDYDEKGKPLRHHTLQFTPQVVLDDIYEADMLPGEEGHLVLPADSTAPDLPTYEILPDLDEADDASTERNSVIGMTPPVEEKLVLDHSCVSMLSIKIFPNPTHAGIHLRAEIETETLLSVRVLSLGGQVLHSQDWQAGPGAELPLPIERLSPATYLLDVRSANGGVFLQRFVIQ